MLIGRYGKSYGSAEEILKRFAVFSENLELIRSTNRKGLPYRLGINRKSASLIDLDRSLSFGSMGGRLIWLCFFGRVRGYDMGGVRGEPARGGSELLRDAEGEPPDDRRGAAGDEITVLFKNGSTTGALEAAYTQATGKSISLSEQQLVDCAHAFNNFGCNGGLPSQAFEYIKYNGGLDTEESYPYRGVNGVCQYKPESVGVKVLDSVNVTLVKLMPLFSWETAAIPL
ncbi:hypothetical protein GW17_00027556 [Ensete ventricosum]|nr:hypothetical protein GW17_00027556 [Ensete ventricosum]